MPSYRDLLQQVKSEIDEIDAQQAARPAGVRAAVFVDVRDRNEWDEGHIPGAVHVPRGNLESRIEAAVPDRDTPGGRLLRLRRAAPPSPTKSLEELGYENVSSLAGGFNDWKRNGFAFDVPRGARRGQAAALLPPPPDPGGRRGGPAEAPRLAHPPDRRRRARARPRRSTSPRRASGTLGIVDDDVVDDSNLQRQIVHSTERLGDSKAESAKRTIEALNPDVTVKVFQERLTSENVDRILGEGWDVIVDGADNFPTRYLLNDASVWHEIPVVHGSIYRFEGQTTVFKPKEGPCYRCLFPQPPPPELAPSCAEGGVLGVLPGIVGSLQANEALKLALGIGEPLVGRLLLFDALETQFTEISLRRDPECPVCGDHPTITDYIDYVEFCQGAPHQVAHVTRVRIPPTLRAEVGGAREVEATGSTMRDVLADLAERFPGLGRQVLEDGDGIAPFVNVYLDSEDVRTLDGLDTPVREDSTVILLPAMAGGERTLTPSLLETIGSTRRSSSCRGSPRTTVSGCTRSSRARTRRARSRTASPRR